MIWFWQVITCICVLTNHNWKFRRCKQNLNHKLIALTVCGLVFLIPTGNQFLPCFTITIHKWFWYPWFSEFDSTMSEVCFFLVITNKWTFSAQKVVFIKIKNVTATITDQRTVKHLTLWRWKESDVPCALLLRMDLFQYTNKMAFPFHTYPGHSQDP